VLGEEGNCPAGNMSEGKMSYAPLHSVPRQKFFLGRRSNHINTTVSTLSEGSKVFQLKHVAWSELIVLYDSVSVAAALHLPHVPFPLCLIIADKPKLQAASINTFPLNLERQTSLISRVLVVIQPLHPCSMRRQS